MDSTLIPIAVALITALASLIVSIWTARSAWKSKIVDKRAEYLENKLKTRQSAHRDLMSVYSHRSPEYHETFRAAAKATMEGQDSDLAHDRHQQQSALELLSKPEPMWEIFSRVHYYIDSNDVSLIMTRYQAHTAKAAEFIASFAESKSRPSPPSWAEAGELGENMLQLVAAEIQRTVLAIEANFSLHRTRQEAARR